MIEHDKVLIAFSLTLFAGLSTGVGSALAFYAKRTNTTVLSLSLGFSAGVMIYVSFIEIFPKAQESLVDSLGKVQGTWATVAAFFVGIIFIALIDKLVPDFENPHEVHRAEEMDAEKRAPSYKKLYKMGVSAALAIGIHNFPEGLATFMSAMKDPKLGVAIALAIAIHNIPEGIAVSIPIYYSTGSRRKAFVFSFLSGVSEPIGAIVGFTLLLPFLNDILFGLLFAFVAGVMVFISLDELLPASREYDQPHLAAYGLVSGMLVMAVSLLLFL